MSVRLILMGSNLLISLLFVCCFTRPGYPSQRVSSSLPVTSASVLKSTTHHRLALQWQLAGGHGAGLGNVVKQDGNCPQLPKFPSCPHHCANPVFLRMLAMLTFGLSPCWPVSSHCPLSSDGFYPAKTHSWGVSLWFLVISSKQNGAVLGKQDDRKQADASPPASSISREEWLAVFLPAEGVTSEASTAAALRTSWVFG